MMIQRTLQFVREGIVCGYAVGDDPKQGESQDVFEERILGVMMRLVKQDQEYEQMRKQFDKENER